MHIKQRGAGVYTYVLNATGDLTQHPAIKEHPEKFRIVEGNPPEGAQGLIYESETSPLPDAE